MRVYLDTPINGMAVNSVQQFCMATLAIWQPPFNPKIVNSYTQYHNTYMNPHSTPIQYELIYTQYHNDLSCFEALLYAYIPGLSYVSTLIFCASHPKAKKTHA